MAVLNYDEVYSIISAGKPKVIRIRSISLLLMKLIEEI